MKDSHLKLLRDIAIGPRPGGYEANAKTLAELVNSGLVHTEAYLTPAGRKALVEEETKR